MKYFVSYAYREGGIDVPLSIGNAIIIVKRPPESMAQVESIQSMISNTTPHIGSPHLVKLIAFQKVR